MSAARAAKRGFDMVVAVVTGSILVLLVPLGAVVLLAAVLYDGLDQDEREAA